MKTIIVCGLLGAGKTTFIRHYLEERSEKTVVLVNDFSKLGIDGEILSSSGVESVELPSGCVCCSLKADLITAVSEIRERFCPEQLVIEPSGVASPSSIIETLESLGLDSTVVVGVVDATEFLELYDSEIYGSFFGDQIKNSDVILVNKADLSDAGTVSRTVSRLEGLNPRCVVEPTVYAVISAPLPGMGGERVIDRDGHAHLRFQTVAVAIGDRIPLEHMEELFKEMAGGACGRIVRAKALAMTDSGPYRFDLSFGNINHERFEQTIERGRLAVIGESIITGNIRRLLRQ